LSLFAQAQVFGGGSEVNSGLYHKLPKSKYDEFLTKSNIELSKWLAHEEAISKLLKVNESPADRNLSVIARGSEPLKLEFQNIPRWRTYTSGTTFTHHGMVGVIWEELQKKKNFEFLMNAKATKVLKIGSHFEVQVNVLNVGTRLIAAKKIVMAAGATETPKILMKSGIINWRDTRFQWHPMYRVIVETDKDDLGYGDIDPFQSWTSNFKLKFGSAVSTPGLLATALGQKIYDHKIDQLRSYYVSFSSSGKGGLLPKTSIPWYQFSEIDKKLKIEGINLLGKMVLEAGARPVMGMNPISSKSSTVHIFGSLPLDLDIYVPGTSRLKKHPDIQIADGSILPIGPGVNPQGVVMTTVLSKIEFD